MERIAAPGVARALPRALLLFAILGFLLSEKLAFETDPIGRLRADGSFYYQVARHVAEGRGLLTSVSLYNQGLRELPSPTTVYPLWPLVLGATGRFFGLHRAAQLVPQVLFFVDLLLLYALANRVGRALGGAVWLRARGVPLLDVGHVAVWLLGTQRMFFVHTSVPWTEGLALGLLFGSLLAVSEAARRASAGWALTAGALAGLAYLTRTQMLGLPLAVAAGLAFAPRGGQRWQLPAAALAGSAAALLPWLAFLASFMTHLPPPRFALDFAAYRETPELPAFPGYVDYASFGERLADFAWSFVYAFHPSWPLTYVRAFGPAVYLVPLALGCALWDARRGGRTGTEPDAQRAAWVAVALAALVCLIPVHGLHLEHGAVWRFGQREGLPMVLALLLAAAALWQRGAGFRALVIAALASRLLLPPQTGPNWVHRSGSPTPAEQQLLEWLDAHPEPPVVLSRSARQLAAWRGVTGHWIGCDHTAENTRLLLRHLDIDYLLVYGDERRCPFARGLRGLALFRRFPGEAGSGIHVYTHELRAGAASSAAAGHRHRPPRAGPGPVTARRASGTHP